MMTTVGYARVSSSGQDLTVQLEKLAGCDKVFKEKRSGVDAGRLQHLRLALSTCGRATPCWSPSSTAWLVQQITLPSADPIAAQTNHAVALLLRRTAVLDRS